MAARQAAAGEDEPQHLSGAAAPYTAALRAATVGRLQLLKLRPDRNTPPLHPTPLAAVDRAPATAQTTPAATACASRTTRVPPGSLVITISQQWLGLGHVTGKAADVSCPVFAHGRLQCFIASDTTRKKGGWGGLAAVVRAGPQRGLLCGDISCQIVGTRAW